MSATQNNTSSVAACNFEQLRLESSAALRKEWVDVLSNPDHPEWEVRWAGFKEEFRRRVVTAADFRTYAPLFVELDRPAVPHLELLERLGDLDLAIARRRVRTATAVFALDSGPELTAAIAEFWKTHP